MIYRMWNGHHIDLSKIVSISEPAATYNYEISFGIAVQLRDSNLIFTEPLQTTFNKEVGEWQYLMTDGTMQAYPADFNQTKQVADLRAKVAELITVWKQSNEPVRRNKKHSTKKRKATTRAASRRR